MENRNLEQLQTIANACSVGCDDLATNGELIDTLYMQAEAGQLNAGDGTMVVDNALNTESINPVQNKVIARLIPAEADSINKLADKKYVNDQIAAHAEGYVAKEDGKGLSSCDFTVEAAEYLNSLENYDDSDLRNQITNKVDKIEGKGLSTNDFTNEYKTKLDELTSPDTNNLQSLIASKADINHTHDEYLVLSDLDGKVDKVEGKGLSTNDYTDEEKAKVEALDTFGETFNNQLANKVDKIEGKGLSTNDFTTEEKTKLASLSNFNDSSLRELIATKAEATHSHTEYVERAELDRKVDKVDGKGLSTNDFTNEYKTKLDTLVSYNDAELQEKITNIETLIPNQASETNQLADKEFVNSSIATATANFVGTFNSLSNLQQSSGHNLNDYAFVHGLDEVGNTTYNRYKWNGSEWLFEYKLNNSSFTAEQWASINSGFTADDKAKLSFDISEVEKRLESPLPWRYNYLLDGYSASLPYRKICTADYTYSDDTNWNIYSEIEMIYTNVNGVFERGTLLIFLRGRGSTISDKYVSFYSLSGGITFLSKTKINYKIDTTNKTISFEILVFSGANYTNILFRNSLTRLDDMLTNVRDFWVFEATSLYNQLTSTMQAGTTSGYTEITVKSTSLTSLENRVAALEAKVN